jgi:glycosyltransferase involved in cell wall biosynthesis
MERVLAELIRCIHREWRITVIAAELAADLRPLVDWRPVGVPRRPIPLKFAMFFVLGSLQLARVRTDVVHVTGAIVANRADLATVHFCHAGFRRATGRLTPEDQPVLRRLNTAMARWLAVAAERWCFRPTRLRFLAAVSHGLVTELTSHFPAVPIRLTPNGVDIKRFAPDAEAGVRLRRDAGLQPGELVALFVGGDWDRKGLAVAIRGIAAAQGNGAELRLWVVGQGQRDRFREVAEQNGIAHRVRFFGARPDVERFYQAADMFVLPTAYEASPLVLHEAAACALPIIATRVNGIEELVGDDEAGLVVERTSRSVGNALSRLARDQTLRHALGAEGRRRAAGRTWERSIQSVMELYGLTLGKQYDRFEAKEPIL